MITEDVETYIYKACYDMFKIALPDEYIKQGDDNGNLPEGPFTTITLDTAIPTTHTASARTIPKDLSGKQETYTQYLATIVVVCFGKGAFTRANILANSFRIRPLREIISNRGLGYSATSSVYNVSRTIDGTKVEKAHQFSVQLYFTQGGLDLGDDPLTIETVSHFSATYNY